MAFFDNLTTLLKQKWLQFFQANRSWITLHMEMESVYTPDGGRRPPSSFILGVVNALEPQLAEMMLPFSKLNPDADTLINVLELNFDPNLLLGDRFNPQAVPEELSADIVIQALTELNLDELSDMSLDDMVEEVVFVETNEHSVVALSEDEAATLIDDMSLDDMAEEDDHAVVVLSEDEAAALIDGMANQEGFEGSVEQLLETSPIPPQQSVDESLKAPTLQQDESSDVLADVWVEDAGSKSEQAGDGKSLGAEKQSEDDEISRLFPNL